MMSEIFCQVEDLGPVENVRVVHRRLRIPRDEYIQQMARYDAGSFEEPAQLFVRDYLRWKGDDPGLVGMVRGWEEGEWVFLDATLRYPMELREH